MLMDNLEKERSALGCACSAEIIDWKNIFKSNNFIAQKNQLTKNISIINNNQTLIFFIDDENILH